MEINQIIDFPHGDVKKFLRKNEVRCDYIGLRLVELRIVFVKYTDRFVSVLYYVSLCLFILKSTYEPICDQGLNS